LRKVFAANTSAVTTLVPNCASLSVVPPDTPAPAGCAVALLDTATTLYVHLKGLLDPTAELEKLHKHKEAAEAKAAALRARMEAPAYENTPEDRKTVDQAKMADFQAEIDHVDKAIAEMEALAAC
jgi:valyl-tRNA synthetase